MATSRNKRSLFSLRSLKQKPRFKLEIAQAFLVVLCYMLMPQFAQAGIWQDLQSFPWQMNGGIAAAREEVLPEMWHYGQAGLAEAFAGIKCFFGFGCPVENIENSGKNVKSENSERSIIKNDKDENSAENENSLQTQTQLQSKGVISHSQSETESLTIAKQYKPRETQIIQNIYPAKEIQTIHTVTNNTNTVIADEDIKNKVNQLIRQLDSDRPNFSVGQAVAVSASPNLGGDTLRIGSGNFTVDKDGNIAAAALALGGNLTVNGAQTNNNIANFNATTTFNANVIPQKHLTTDLGSPTNWFNNIYAGTINTAGINTSGQGIFNYIPADISYNHASMLINPTSAPSGSLLFALGIAGVQKYAIDRDGNVSGGTYNGLTINPTTGTLVIANGKTLTLTNDATISGTNTGDQTITLTGDITGSSTSSIATTISDNAVTLAKIQTIAPNILLGNNTGANQIPAELTPAQTKSLLAITQADVSGLTTASSPLFAGLTLNGNLALGTNTLTTANIGLIANLNADMLDGQHGAYYVPLANIAGASGYLPKFTGTNSVGNSVIYENSGSLGISITNPSYKLDVNGTAGFSTSTNSPIFQGQAAAVTFGNAGYATTIAGSALTINPASWTTAPTISGLITAASGLTANGALTANNVFTLGDNGDTGSINTSDWDISAAGTLAGISGIANDGGYTQSGTDANTFTGTATFSNPAYSALFTGGNVGIGTTNPKTSFHIYNGAGTGASDYNSTIDAIIEDNASAYLGFNGSGYAGVVFNDDNASIRAGMVFDYYNDNIMFSTGSTDDRLVITEGGNIGINTANPGAKLDVRGGFAAGTNGTEFTISDAGLVTGGTYNKVAITAPATGATLTIADGKTLTVSNSIALAGTDGKTLNIGANNLTFLTAGDTTLTLPASGTVAATSNKLSDFALTTSAELAGAISNETGSGALVFGTSPTFTTQLTTPKVVGDSTGLYLHEDGGNGIFIKDGGNVGIGTTAPGTKFQVNGQAGTGETGVANITGYDAYGQNLVMQLPSAGYTGNLIALMKAAGGSGQAMGFSTHFTSDVVDRFSIMNHSGTENLTVLDSGNVGIGIINPSSKLDVSGDIRISSGSGGQIIFADGSTMASAALGSAAALSNASDAIITGDSDASGAGDVILKTGSNDRLHILNSGNVGIGIAAPGELLSVGSGFANVNMSIGTATNNRMYFGTFNDSVTWSLNRRPSDGYIPNASESVAGLYMETGNNTSQITFLTGNTNGSYSERMRIDKDGNVGIGTTAPGYKFRLLNNCG